MDNLAAKQLIEDAHCLISESKYAEALPLFERLTKLLDDARNKAVAIANAGVCYAHLGNDKEAIEYLNAAIKCDPLCALAFFNRGAIRERNGDVEHAIRDYGRATKADPACADAYLNKGICLQKKGLVQEAVEQLVKAAELAPTNPKFQKNAGVVYLMNNDPANAFPYFVREIRLRKGNKDSRKGNTAAAVAFVNAGQCYRAQSDFRRAIKAAQLALKIDGQHAGGYEELGNNRFFMNQFTQAVMDYTKALKLSKSMEVVEKIEMAALESKLFKDCAQDCSQAQAGIIAIDELIVRLDRVISAAVKKYTVNKK